MLGTVYQNSIFDELRNQGYKDPLIFQEKHSKNQARCRFVIMACRHTLHEVDTKRLKSYVCIIAGSCSMSGTLHQFIRAEQYWFAAHDSKHIDIIFGLQCLKPSVYDCVAGRIHVTERLNQHSLQMPVRQPCHRFYHRQDCKQRLGVLERRTHLVPVCTRYLLVSLRIIPDADGAYRLQSKSDSDRSYRVTATRCQCGDSKATAIGILIVCSPVPT